MFPDIPFVMVHMDLETDHKQALDFYIHVLQELIGEAAYEDLMYRNAERIFGV